MFDTSKFGRGFASLRKAADMTQSELADRLNLSRQAISRYEMGDSFPDVSILIAIAEIFHVSLDRLISLGEPTIGEAQILSQAAAGGTPIAETAEDVVNLAPHLKPSVLGELSEQLTSFGISIAGLVDLAAYLNDENTVNIIKNTSLDQLNGDLLQKLLPVLGEGAKYKLFQMVFDGELDYHRLKELLPYVRSTFAGWGREYGISLIEEGVIAGTLPFEALKLVREFRGF